MKTVYLSEMAAILKINNLIYLKMLHYCFYVVALKLRQNYKLDILP